MLAARLNRKVEFQTITTTKNSFGAVQEGYSHLKNKYASVTIRSTNSVNDGEGNLVANYTNFYVRYDDSINYDTRIVYNSDNYKILSIDEIGRKEAMSINAMRVENE